MQAFRKSLNYDSIISRTRELWIFDVFLHITLLFIAVYDVIKQYDFVSIPFYVKNSVLAFHWCIIYVSTKHGSTYTLNKVWKIFPSLNSSKTPIMDSLSRALLAIRGGLAFKTGPGNFTWPPAHFFFQIKHSFIRHSYIRPYILWTKFPN